MVRVSHVHASVDKEVDLLRIGPPGGGLTQGQPVVADTALYLIIASKRLFGYSF
jgi:hypothetical protein